MKHTSLTACQALRSPLRDDHVRLAGVLFCVLFFQCILTESCQATTLAGAIDTESGYAQGVLDKVMQKWSPPALRGSYSVRVKVSLDGSGRVTSCKAVRSSSIEVFDQVVCSAVHAAGPFGRTSYEAPLDLYLTFSLGAKEPKKNEGVSDIDALRAEMNARSKAEREQAERSAGAVEDRARERALAAARSQGKDLPEIHAQPLAQHPKNAQSETKKPEQPGKKEKEVGQPKEVSQTAPVEERPLRTGVREPVPPRPLPTYGEYGGVRDAHADPSLLTSSSVSAPRDEKALIEARLKKYTALLERYLNRVLVLPPKVPSGEYSMIMKVGVASDGKITEVGVIRSSGDETADAAMLRSVKQSRSVPAPPKSIGNSFQVPLKAQKAR